MIVPETRLLVWAGAALLPMAATASPIPEVALPGLALSLVALAAASIDALRARRALEGITVLLPDVVRLAKDRAGRIDLRIRNAREQACRLRLGIPLPAGVESPQEDLVTALPEGQAGAWVTWPCTPRKRGRFPLEACCLESTSPWGLWAWRQQQPVSTEIRVYPNLLTERRGVAALFLNRGMSGIHAQRQVGKGRDFEKLREYIAGDSFDDVHWKATAKRGRPVTKVFQIERTQEVYVAIDASRLSAREVCPPGSSSPPSPLPGAAGRAAAERVTTVLDRYLTAGLVLGLAAQRQGDLFGLLTFDDRVQRFVRARSGRDHYGACRDALYTLEPRLVTPAFEDVCSFLRLRLRRRALVIFLTSLDDPVLAEQFVQAVDLVCRQHLVLVNLVPPPGVEPLFAGRPAGSVEGLYRQLVGHLRWQELRELQTVLQRRGVRLNLLAQEGLSAQLVTQYLEVKRAQRL